MSRTGRLVSVLALAACVPLAACGTQSASSGGADPGGGTTVSPTDPTPTDPTPADEPTAGPTPGSSSPSPPVMPGPSGTPVDVVALAIEDLARHVGIDAGRITVATNEEVTWRDGSLGCPKKGMGYITVLIPGHRVVLEADGATYEYHAGNGGAPFRCDNPEPPLPPGPQTALGPN